MSGSMCPYLPVGIFSATEYRPGAGLCLIYDGSFLRAAVLGREHKGPAERVPPVGHVDANRPGERPLGSQGPDRVPGPFQRGEGFFL